MTGIEIEVMTEGQQMAKHIKSLLTYSVSSGCEEQIADSIGKDIDGLMIGLKLRIKELETQIKELEGQLESELPNANKSSEEISEGIDIKELLKAVSLEYKMVTEDDDGCRVVQPPYVPNTYWWGVYGRDIDGFAFHLADMNTEAKALDMIGILSDRLVSYWKEKKY